MHGSRSLEWSWQAGRRSGRLDEEVLRSRRQVSMWAAVSGQWRRRRDSPVVFTNTTAAAGLPIRLALRVAAAVVD